TWAGSNTWMGSMTTPCAGRTLSLGLMCGGTGCSGFSIHGYCAARAQSNIGANQPDAGCTCAPTFSLTYSNVGVGNVIGGCCSGTIKITVTGTAPSDPQPQAQVAWAEFVAPAHVQGVPIIP